MSVSRGARPDADTSELALDRSDRASLDQPGPSAVEPWRPTPQGGARPAEAYPVAAQRVETWPRDAPAPRRSFDPIGTLSGLVGLAFKLTFLLILVTMLWAMAGLIGIGGSVTSGVGARVSS